MILTTNGHITFAWDAATDPSSVGYRLFYGPSTGNYPYHADVGNVLQYTIRGLPRGQTYYGAAQSLDLNGNLLDTISNEDSGTVIGAS